MAGSYQSLLAQAQAFIAEGQPKMAQVDAMLASVNLDQYLPGCGINATQAVSLLQGAVDYAQWACNELKAAFAAAGCPMPAGVASDVATALTSPRWENTGGEAYGTVYSTGSGAGVCLDMNDFYPSCESIWNAAESAVAAAPAAIAACLARKGTPREGAPKPHGPRGIPLPTTGPTGNRFAGGAASGIGKKAGQAMKRVGQIPTVSSGSPSTPSLGASIGEGALGLGLLGIVAGALVGLFADDAGGGAVIGGGVGAILGAIGGYGVYQDTQAQQSNGTSTSTPAAGG